MSATTCDAESPTADAIRGGGALPEPRRWTMFVILLVGTFLPPLDFFIVNVALPSIRDELGASSSTEQFVISTYAAL